MPKKIEPETVFVTPDGLTGRVLYQIEMFTQPGRPGKLVDNYRVEILGSTIQYASSSQIREWEKNIK